MLWILLVDGSPEKEYSMAMYVFKDGTKVVDRIPIKMPESYEAKIAEMEKVRAGFAGNIPPKASVTHAGWTISRSEEWFLSRADLTACMEGKHE